MFAQLYANQGNFTWENLSSCKQETEGGARWKEQRWHSRFVHGLYAGGPEFDPWISHPCYDFFPFCVAQGA